VITRVHALPYERKVLVVYVLALFMTVIDSTMVNVALPTIAGEFGVEPSDAEWVAVGYLLAVAAVIPPAGWLGDRFGTKRVFLLALVAFTIVSMLCGFAQTLDQLVFLRVLQGLGGGLLMPVGSAMLYRAFPMSRRPTAAAAVLSVVVTAPALGPLLGGILVDQASWRWIFLINIPIGAVGVLLGRAVLREETQESPGRFDVAGMILGTGSVSILLYTMSIGPDVGWTSVRVLGLGIVGLVALIVMIVIELRIREPMLALRLFRDRLFRSVNVASSLIYAGFFGVIFLLPIYMQSLRGYSAFESGLAQSPQALGILVVSNTVGRRAYRTIGPRRLMAVGTAVAAVGTSAYGLADLDTPLGAIAGLSFVRGLAMGFVFISIQTAIYATTSVPDTGRATSLFNTQRQFANASGVAIAATLLAAGFGRLDDDAAAIDRLPTHQWAFVAVGVLMVPAIFLSLRIRDDDVAETRGLEPAGAPTSA